LTTKNEEQKPRMPAEVPADFPRLALNAALPGVHLKFSTVYEDGKYYAQGMSPTEVLNDYLLCEDIAQEMIRYYEYKLVEGKLNPEQIISRSYESLTMQMWCRPEHAPWVIRRLATLVNVTVPSEIPESPTRK
jgi:hypothetical protein